MRSIENRQSIETEVGLVFARGGSGRGSEGVTAKVCAVSVFLRSMSRLILFIIINLMEYNCFTTLHYFLLDSKVSQPHVCRLLLLSLFATPWTAAHQAPPSVRLSRREHWSGAPSPSPDVHTYPLFFNFRPI